MRLQAQKKAAASTMEGGAKEQAGFSGGGRNPPRRLKPIHGRGGPIFFDSFSPAMMGATARVGRLTASLQPRHHRLLEDGSFSRRSKRRGR